MPDTPIVLIGNQSHADEFAAKFADKIPGLNPEVWDMVPDYLTPGAIVFLFDTAIDTDTAMALGQAASFIFINSVNTTLADLAVWMPLDATQVAGFNGLPTLLNRSLLECTLLDPATQPRLAEVCALLGTDFRVVADRCGMVTARVVAMIINEAYHTLGEGTASREDIDLAMRLGVNYPHGPFAWANQIGLPQVYELLKAVYTDTQDPRYRVAPLLKQEALHAQRWQ